MQALLKGLADKSCDQLVILDQAIDTLLCVQIALPKNSDPDLAALSREDLILLKQEVSRLYAWQISHIIHELPSDLWNFIFQELYAKKRNLHEWLVLPCVCQSWYQLITNFEKLDFPPDTAIPPFSNLRSLSISASQLPTALILPNLGKLQELTVLGTGSFDIEPSFPIMLTQLTCLTLKNHPPVEPNSLARLTNLTRLKLHSDFVDHVSTLTNLHSLKMTESRIPCSDLVILSNLKLTSMTSDSRYHFDGLNTEHLNPIFKCTFGKYRGSWKNAEFDGKGCFTWKDGDTYEGDWVRAARCGKGVFIAANGDRYDGEWKADQFNGKGIWKDDKTSYDGEWVNCRRQGRGISIDKDERRYEGEWLRDKEHGKGIMTDKTGSYEGDWYKGRRHGRGIAIHPNGKIYDGEWRDDRQHGKGVLTLGDFKYDGDWERGRRSGKATVVYPDGRRYEGMFIPQPTSYHPLKHHGPHDGSPQHRGVLSLPQPKFLG